AKGSKQSDAKKHSLVNRRNIDQRVVTAFNAISRGNETISCKHFTERFGEDLGSGLWRYLSDSASEKWQLDLAHFGVRFLSLIGTSTDRYVEILLPPERMLRVSAQCAMGEYLREEDEDFLHVLLAHIEKVGSSPAAITKWKDDYCNRLCDSVQTRVMSSLNLLAAPTLNDYGSDILSTLQMWFIHCSLPQIYLPKSKAQEGDSSPLCWTPLYSSRQQGISVTMFEASVFGYRGPTVTIFRLKDGAVTVLAADDEWRNSGSMFGSVDSVLMQLLPEFKRIQKSSSIYCNFRLRNFPMRLAFDRYLCIDAEMNEVLAVEVFGCGGAQTLQEQQKIKEWQRRQIEKNKKVPLPGKWDDNPDKFILELGGVYPRDNRREIYRRDD
uniref:TLDc domain-containing protein n=1 Tax=Parascaris univalens TaxID=6257 RepID=A0A915C434_PARUN